MRKLATALAIGFLALSVAGCSKVPAGTVGIRVNLLGGAKGVDHDVLDVGRYWIGFNQELYVYPTFTQTYTWTKSPNEGRATDESITFQTSDGLAVNADVGISFNLEPKKVPDIFQKYRRGIDEITDIYLRNMVRDALVREASTKPIESVYGAGKADLIAAAEKDVRAEVGDLGIHLEHLYWVGDLRLPKNVTDSINSKIEATQLAQKKENEVAISRAEAQKVVETAKGDAESVRVRAEAEAAAIKLRGDALRQNPDVIKLNFIEKWNGELSKFAGGSANPMFMIDGKEGK